MSGVVRALRRAAPSGLYAAGALLMERFSSPITRAAVSDAGVLSGLAAVFDQPTTRQREYAGTETIARTAFNGLLGVGDVLALVNHDPSQLLGRSASGTLRLQVGREGLEFELDLPDTTLGRDVRELVKRGDLSGMSFSAQVGTVDRSKGGVVHRQFKSLVDISVVTLPAYVGTNVVAREASEQSLRGQLARLRHNALKGD